jgi:cytochrome c oxidase cbb3-type subunit 3
MAMTERDPESGYLTTGHEWNGIKELNTPVPRAVYVFLLLAFIFALGCWLLMPAWPLGTSYTKGLWGIDQRTTVQEALKQGAQERSAWGARIEAASFATVQGDAALMSVVRKTGRTLFIDNCAVCHGVDAKGGKGFPNLTTGSWLWGGDAEAIAETIRIGINSTHPDTRVSQMLAFGRDQVVSRADVDNVVTYVLSLSSASQGTAEARAAGKAVFEANCVACHGDDGKGKVEMGAPDLTDASWIYGGSRQAVFETVWGGRQGHMPTWEGRLSPLDRKILALYLVDLRKAGP